MFNNSDSEDFEDLIFLKIYLFFKTYFFIFNKPNINSYIPIDLAIPEFLNSQTFTLFRFLPTKPNHRYTEFSLF